MVCCALLAFLWNCSAQSISVDICYLQPCQRYVMECTDCTEVKMQTAVWEAKRMPISIFCTLSFYRTIGLGTTHLRMSITCRAIIMP